MNWLLLASAYFLFLRAHGFWLQLFVALAALCYLYYRKTDGKALLLFAFLCAVSLIPSNIQNESRQGIVIERKANYAIADFDGMKVLVNGEVFPKDVIERIDDFSAVQSLSNFHLFDFQAYCAARGIEKALYDDDYVVVENHDSLQKAVYQRIQAMDEEKRTVLNRIFYQQQTDDLSYLIVSGGLHFSSINRFLLHLFSSFWCCGLLASAVLMLFGFSFGFHFSIQRLLIHNILRLNASLTSKECLGAEMLCLMFLHPYCVFDSAFLFPFALRFFSSFNVSKMPKMLFSSLLIGWLQCYLSNQCNLTELFLHKFYRNINTIAFLTGLFVLIMPILDFLLLPIQWLFDLTQYLPSFVLSGHPALILSLMFFVSFAQLLEQLQRRSCLICLASLCLIPLQAYFVPYSEVVFINVGQGDCILIRAPFNQANILIDIPSAYNKSLAEEVVVPYLKSIGVFHLDALILTHEDSDHSGGKEDLMKLMPVKEVIEQPQEIQIGPLHLLSLNALETKDENESSLVYYAEIGGLNYLFLADVPQSVEEAIVQEYEMKLDVVKIAHHGSNTSTSPYFIQNTRPQLALISAGADNRYGHPHQETLDTLTNYQVKTMITYESGAISIKSFLNFNFIVSSLKEFGIIVAE